MAGASEHSEVPRSHDDARTEPIRYPTHSILAVFDTEEQLIGAIEALTRGGFLGSELHVACGTDAADRLAESAGRGGLAGMAIRIAQRLGLTDEEMEIKSRYEQALRDGRIVLRVAIPTESRKDRAAEILREHGAHSVAYHGRFMIEGLGDA